MTQALLLLPDFLLILIGFLICRFTFLDASIWSAAEKLVYHVLFPVLLFNSIVRTPLQPADTWGLATAAVATVLCGVVLAYALARVPGVDRGLHASGAQTAFRFNSFIALALAERLGGPQALAWMALMVALCVPLCNVAAVWPLARHGGHHVGRELLRNPLILSTAAGLAANLLGLRLPEAVGTTLQRIGLAALPIGLMAVGASLQLGALREGKGLATALLTVRHFVLPCIALLWCFALGLPPEQRTLVVIFAALPTASSAYVLAVRMGGHGPFVAGLVTVSTLVGMATVPLWLAALTAWFPS